MFRLALAILLFATGFAEAANPVVTRNRATVIRNRGVFRVRHFGAFNPGLGLFAAPFVAPSYVAPTIIAPQFAVPGVTQWAPQFAPQFAAPTYVAPQIQAPQLQLQAPMPTCGCR